MLQYSETPVQEVKDDVTEKAGIKLLIKREDLNHPFVSGNKWWKLKYNLEEASRQNMDTLLTYGGAYSNHIFATAAAAAELGFKSIGIIRGEENLPLNPVLAFAHDKGMELHFIPRSAYAKKSQFDEYLKRLKNFYWIPEGGTNELAVKGVCEFASILNIDFDYLCCSVGTAGTLSGLIEGTTPGKKIVGFAALKGGEFLADEVKELVPESQHSADWEIIHDFHFGGYAKKQAELVQFIEHMKSIHSLPLDFVYTGKMMYGIYVLMRRGFFKSGSTILVIHSGGLQSAGTA